MIRFTSKHKAQTSLIALSLMSWVLLVSWSMIQLCRLTIRSDLYRDDFHQRTMLVRDCLDQAILNELDGKALSSFEYRDLRLSLKADRHEGQFLAARNIELRFKTKPEWVRPKGLHIHYFDQQLMIYDFP